jgi:O-antigen ligase/DNA-binding SARP family transcriptional activator
LKSKIINYLPYLVAIFIATNALFASFGKWLFAPEDVKTFIAMIGVFPLLLVWSLFYGGKNNFTIVKSNLYLPIALFLIWCFYSLTYAVDTASASYITYQYATMIAVFFLTANTFKNIAQIKFFLNFLLLVVVLVIILAALQFYLPLNLTVQNFVYQAVTPAGTFGNKNMLGHFLVIMLPIAFSLALLSNKTIKVIIYTLIAVLIATMLIHINTRATWISSFVVLTMLVFFVFINKNNFGKQFFKQKILIFVFGFALWFVFINTDANGFKWRFDSVSERIESTIKHQNPRIPMWANTLVMIADNPALGVGVGGWRNAYPKYYDSVLKDSTFNESVRAERVHNEYLEMISGVGLIGFAIFLWAAFLIVKTILKVLKSKNTIKSEFYLILGIGLSIVGYSINAFFSFPVRVFFPAFLIMAFVGIIVAVYNKSQQIQFWQFSRQFGYLLSVPIIMLGVIFAWQSYNTLLSVNYHYEAQAYEHGKSNEYRSMVFKKLLKSIYYNPENSIALSRLGGRTIRLGHFEKGIDLVEKSLKTRPYHDASLLRLAMAYDVSGKKDMAIKTLHRILAFDKRSVKAHGQLARLYSKTGDRKNALKHKDLMDKWMLYFKDRKGFGPYDKLQNYVDKELAKKELAKSNLSGVPTSNQNPE